jgi:hypothetical protein
MMLMELEGGGGGGQIVSQYLNRRYGSGVGMEDWR